MDALGALKSACVKKQNESFKDLQPGEYLVYKFTEVSTTHGNRIRIDLLDTYMILPERFAKILTEPIIDDLNKSTKVMIYGGKDSSNRDRLILDFRDESYFADLLSHYST